MNHQNLPYKIVKEVLPLDTIYYCVAKKESETGLIFNDRLFVIREKSSSIFYTKDIPIVPYLHNGNFPKGKKTISLSEIEVKNKNNGKVKIFAPHKNLSWKFSFANEELAQKWVFLIQFLQERIQTSLCSMKSTSSGGSIKAQMIYNELSQENKFDYGSIIHYERNQESILKNMQNKIDLNAKKCWQQKNEKYGKGDACLTSDKFQ